MIDPSAVDFGKTAGDYARHRAGFPEELFERLAGFGVGLPGQRVVDLGTGAGTMARGFAARGCLATGIDIAPALLEEARRLAAGEGRAVEFRLAAAEQTGLPGESFDGVAAGQCWHWFDRPRAAQEVRRLLVPGGWLLIAHFNWIPLPGNVAEATEQLIEHHNPAWGLGGGSGVHPAWLRDVALAGFRHIETFSFDTEAPYTHSGWRARIRASAGVGASLPAERVARFDQELRGLLEERFPTEPLCVPHRVFALICRSPVTAAGLAGGNP